MNALKNLSFVSGIALNFVGLVKLAGLLLDSFSVHANDGDAFVESINHRMWTIGILFVVGLLLAAWPRLLPSGRSE